jgi:hypothetical protein
VFEEGVRMSSPDGAIDEEDQAALKAAVAVLEAPGFVARVSGLIGTPVEKALAKLPKNAHAMVAKATRKAIEGALKVALRTMDRSQPAQDAAPASWDRLHVMASMASGGVGGFFGLGALAVELPISTTIMMRSIADIARSEGADLADPTIQVECLQVLALGGRTAAHDAAESSYYTTRLGLATAIREMAAFVTKHGFNKEVGPVVVRLLSVVMSRFEPAVAAKVASQAMPAIGALGGMTINALFMNHFQDMAHGHFTVRRLEGKYGVERVRAEYEAIRAMPSATALSAPRP